MKTVAVLFAEGFEEIEGVAIVDVLRRAQCRVIAAGVAGREVTGAHAMTLRMDALLGELVAAELDAVVLPGGLPGSTNLAASPAVLKLLRQTAAAGKLVAALCAAPLVLEAAGLLKGKRITCYPGCEGQCGSAQATGERVQVDGKLVTGRGPGAAIEFALEVATQLGLGETAEKLRQGMIVK